MEHDQLTLQPLQKCTERANASDDLADIVQLVNDGVHANYHYGHDRLPAIHLLCHRWVTMSGKETSQWLRGEYYELYVALKFLLFREIPAQQLDGGWYIDHSVAN